LGYDFLADPVKLSTYPYAALSAGEYWKSRKLNSYADYLQVETITRKVNGGTTHLERRIDYTNKALEVLGETARVEKKKTFLVVAALVVALTAIVLVINYQPVQKWIRTKIKPLR
jgi:cytochrome c-type biogenesis protein CcmH/NrfG